MPFEWPQARELTDAEKGVIGYALKRMGHAVAEVRATVMPSLSLNEDLRPRFVGKVYLLAVRSAPVALARNAYSRHFPAVEGPTSAEYFAAQLRQLQADQDIAGSTELLHPAYLASPLTSDYCAAAVGRPLIRLRWVATTAGSARVPQVRTAHEFLLDARRRLQERILAQDLAPPGDSPTN
jgi:hypothetical protein